MKILVVLKQIPDHGTWEEYQDAGILNDSDKNVLKEALDLREAVGGYVDVMALGPTEGEDVLKEALTFGIDRAILVADPAYEGLDIRGAGKILGTAIRKLGPYDLILCGRQALDGDSAHMAAMIAGNAHLPLLPYTKEIRIQESTLTARCSGDQEDSYMECEMPVMALSIREQNQNRYPLVSDILKTYNGEYQVERICDQELKAEAENAKVKKIRTYMPVFEKKHQLKMLDGRTEEERADQILHVLRKLNFL